MYNLRLIFQLALVFCSLNLSAQDIFTEIHGKKMKTFIDIEKKQGGELYRKSGDIIIPGGMSEPLTYRRAQKGIPDLLITYTFSKTDSLVNRIEYEWDIINFDENKKLTLEVHKTFIKKYQSLVDQLSHKHGKSVQEGDLNNLAKIELKGGLRRSDEWKPNDSSSVSMYSVFSNYQEENGNVKIIPTNRIRIYVSKIKKSTRPELSDKAIENAKRNYDLFINKLRIGDLEGAKVVLSPQIRSQMTEPVFNQIKAAIKPESFKIYIQGLQFVNGTDYLMIQYAYISAPEVPNEIVRVLFDKENLIIGIQPLTRKE